MKGGRQKGNYHAEGGDCIGYEGEGLIAILSKILDRLRKWGRGKGGGGGETLGLRTWKSK